MSEYHKIETLYERDLSTHKLKMPLTLKNPLYGCLRSWEWTEKIDGTNIRVMWDYAAQQLTFGGKTDNAQLPADLVNWMRDNVTIAKMQATFPDTSVVVYGEGYGAGIQKGGGDYSPTKKLILFDVFVLDSVNSRLGGWWLSYPNVADIAEKLQIEVVPYIGSMPLEDATEVVRVGFQSKLNGGKKQAEGLVGRPLETLYDKKGHRLICKLKTKDFA